MAGTIALFAPCCILVVFPSYLAAAMRNQRWRLAPLTLVFAARLSVVLTRSLLRFHGPVYLAGGLALIAGAAGALWLSSPAHGRSMWPPRRPRRSPMTRRTAKTDRPGSDLGRWLLSAAPLLAVALAVGMPADQVAHEVQRFGIDLPIRIDEDKTASHAYRLPGQYGHGDRPSHSFALISSDGWTEQAIHYATMFVPLEELLADLEPA